MRPALDASSNEKVVAVAREKRIELWDTATSKGRKAASFECGRIDEARFSPGGKMLAASDRDDLVPWRGGATDMTQRPARARRSPPPLRPAILPPGRGGHAPGERDPRAGRRAV